MIDHDIARRSLATSLDFAIEPAERDALDAHLHDCPACRSFAAATGHGPSATA
jgi:predicted anti-sigma-YlaC factor YlaD